MSQNISDSGIRDHVPMPWPANGQRPNTELRSRMAEAPHVCPWLKPLVPFFAAVNVTQNFLPLTCKIRLWNITTGGYFEFLASSALLSRITPFAGFQHVLIYCGV